MAKPQKPLPYDLPSFKINKVETSLEKDGKIYGRMIYGVDKNNCSVVIRERTGLDIEKYTEKPIECVVEIVKAQIIDIDPEEKKKLPPNAIEATFMGWDTGYKFFPALVSMVDGETGDPELDEDFDEDEYDVLATKLFSEWGIYGFGLDVYRDKPMLKTENGVFFLNEYIFEEFIDKWEESPLPFVEVGIIIEEALLHGINPLKEDWSFNKKVKEEEPLKHYEKRIVGKPRIIDPW